MKIIFLISLLIINTNLYVIGLDLFSAPEIISSGEIYLLTNDPATVFYQPADRATGISINHSNPYGFTELNVVHIASQFPVKTHRFSLGAFVLNNNHISNNTMYLGYSRDIQDISIGSNIRYYNQKITNYNTLEAYTINIGLIWKNNKLTHGISYNNLTHTATKTIDLPVAFKYECLIKPIENTNFAISLMKENNFEIRYAFGVSREIGKTLVVTTGFINNPSVFSLGLSVNINNLSVKYGAKTHNELGYTQAIGINYL